MNEQTKKPHFLVHGAVKLQGDVTISGSKNATLPIMAAALLCKAETVLRNVPDLADVAIMMDVMRALGAIINFDNNTLYIDTRDINNFVTPFELMNRMRASIYVMGPLLARYGQAKISLPGGCAIGSRPVDYHLRNFEIMGAKLDLDHGSIDAKCDRLKGTNIFLDFPSVGATANILMAASLAEGTTVIDNAAEEPHISDLAWFLRSLGARIKGAGTKTITIEGIKNLHGAEHDMIPDQIEAGTFMTAAAITRSTIVLKGANSRDLKPITVKLRETGATVSESNGEIKVSAKKKISATRITTLPHPGFPTDMQPQMMALLATADGVSIIKETVWENRYMHVAELIRMGAEIEIDGHTAVVVGGKKLVGCEVTSPDLRAGAALIVAGLAADNETKVFGVEHIDRGYQNIADKFTALGADVKRIEP